MLTDFSLDLALYFQTLGDLFRAVMEFFSFLGLEDFFMLVMPLFAWVIDYTIGIRLGLMLVISTNINFIFKFIFHTPRPYWLNTEIKPYVPENNFSMPSGHSQIPATVFGLAAVQYKRRWVSGIALFFIFMIGFSRLALGMHMIPDILVGWLIGGLLLWAFIKLEAPVLAWFTKQTKPMQYTYAVLSGIVFALLGALVVQLAGQFDIPALWLQNANLHVEAGETFNPFTLDGVLTPSGVMSGMLVGVLWLQGQGGFKIKGTWWQYILRYAVGLVGILVFWMGLGAVLPRSADLIGYAARFGRYFLVGFWVSGLAPWVFKKLNLTND